MARCKEIFCRAERIAIQDVSGVNELLVGQVFRLPRGRERRQRIRVAAQVERMNLALVAVRGRIQTR